MIQIFLNFFTILPGFSTDIFRAKFKALASTLCHTCGFVCNDVTSKLGNRRTIIMAKGKIQNVQCSSKQLWIKPTARAHLQIFGTGSGDTCPSVYLFADSQRKVLEVLVGSSGEVMQGVTKLCAAKGGAASGKLESKASLETLKKTSRFLEHIRRYVFNCGEATQRLFHESKLKLGKMNCLFFTQINWEFIGGLPGLFLTLRDTGKSELNVHGPENISEFFESCRGFLSTQNMNLNCVGYSGKDCEKFEDENIIVWPICTEGKAADKLSNHSEITVINDKDEVCQSENTGPCQVAEYHQNLKKHKSLYVNTENPKRCKFDIGAKTAISYVCELVPMPGKMNITKARELGVPTGPLLGELQRGQSVTLENGTVIKPDDVIGQSVEACVFCIIDCPSKDHLEYLSSNEWLVMHEEGGCKPLPCIIIHLSPADVVETTEYFEWTKRFGSTCQHLFLNSKMSPPKMAMLSQLGIHYNLHQLNPDIFPKLFASDTPEIEIQGSEKQNWMAGECFLIFHLRPAQKIGFDRSDIKSRWELMAEKAHERLPALTRVISSLEATKSSLDEFIDPRRFPQRDCKTPNQVSDDKFVGEDENFEIVFLGTGASLPSKYRNVSSTLVKISDKKLMLLDCGEGTYGQLFRHYGPDLENILLQLCCVFISHIHADHHLGLMRLLQAWQKITQSLAEKDRPDPILVIGPPSLLTWLRNYGTFHETICLRFFDSSKFQTDSGAGYKTLSIALESEVAIVPVIHCHHAFGLVLTHKNGWKLVYSGDTRPSEDLIKAGLNATVLIHEATFEDDLYGEALLKLHSTTTEAIKCGQHMKAKFIMLNHFSQRYPKIPVFNEKFNDCTGIAFDHMTVDFKNISSVPKLLKPLQEIFNKEIEEQNMVK